MFDCKLLQPCSEAAFFLFNFFVRHLGKVLTYGVGRRWWIQSRQDPGVDTSQGSRVRHRMTEPQGRLLAGRGERRLHPSRGICPSVPSQYRSGERLDAPCRCRTRSPRTPRSPETGTRGRAARPDPGHSTASSGGFCRDASWSVLTVPPSPCGSHTGKAKQATSAGQTNDRRRCCSPLPRRRLPLEVRR